MQLFDGAALGEWQQKTYLSPHMPNGIDHDELFAWGGFVNVLKWDFALLAKRYRKDMRGFGPGMMAYFVKAAMIDRKIPAFLESPVTELIVEDGRRRRRARAAQRQGLHGARAERASCSRPAATTGTPRWPSTSSSCPNGSRCASRASRATRWCSAASSARRSPRCRRSNLGLFFGYNIPGEEQDGKPLWRGSWEGGFPHAIWVNRAGQRFADESFYRDYLPKTRAWDGVTQTQPNFPPYLIFDSQLPREVPARHVSPGARHSRNGRGARGNACASSPASSASTRQGSKRRSRASTRFAAKGVDDDFGRGTYPWAAMMTGDSTRKNPNLGPLDKPPFYGMRLRVASVGINCAGLKTNGDAQVMHVRGRPIPGLYAVGNSAAPLDIGAGYQSGLSNLRGLVGGYLAGRHASSR